MRGNLVPVPIAPDRSPIFGKGEFTKAERELNNKATKQERDAGKG
jgi:hypothetical protein